MAKSNFTNNEMMKLETLASLEMLTNSLKAKVNVLDALDRDDESGCFDLHDQLTTFFKVTQDLGAVVERSQAIVPK